MPSRIEVVEFLRTMLGTPFHHQGRLPGVGIDCIGAVIVPLQYFKIMDYDVGIYSRLPDSSKIYAFLSEAEKNGIAWVIPKKDRLPGDVGLFRIRKEPQHFAWITDVGVLHAQYSNNPKRKSVVEHSMDQKWLDSLIKVYRIKGIE